MLPFRLVACCLLALAVACKPTPAASDDAGHSAVGSDGGVTDAAVNPVPDASVPPSDAGTRDATSTVMDASMAPDAGSPSDAAHAADAYVPDAAVTSSVDAAMPRVLPIQYERTDEGTPVDATELATLTDLYIDLLTRTQYFKFLDSRVHGWPESDPLGSYWYGTWWSGVQVVKTGGAVSYVHSLDGADNNGLRTAQLMESACYAYRLWRRPEDELLLRRLMRGFSSWLLAMKRNAADTEGPLMARASYPAPVDDTVRGIHIDYSPDRPGQGGPTADYVHLPDNPTWGDTWVRNKRSKDDIGHMQRAIAQVDTCSSIFSDAAGRADYDQMRTLHEAFASRVVTDGNRIATLDESLNVVMPTDGFTYYVQLVECPGVLSLHLMAHGMADGVDCGDGQQPGEGLGFVNSSAMQIVRSYHTSATNLALLHDQLDLGRSLLGGLATRVHFLVNAYNSGSPPANINQEDLSAWVIHAINTGVPLTSTEVRWMQARIRDAHTSFLDGHNDPSIHVFDAATPDGTYAYELSGAGIRFNELGTLLGACAAQFRNPASRPVLDCGRVAQAHPW